MVFRNVPVGEKLLHDIWTGTYDQLAGNVNFENGRSMLSISISVPNQKTQYIMLKFFAPFLYLKSASKFAF
jgi:hypothetical protein